MDIKHICARLKDHPWPDTDVILTIGIINQPVERKDGLYLEAGTRQYSQDNPLIYQLIDEITYDLNVCEKNPEVFRYGFYLYKLFPDQFLIRYAKSYSKNNSFS